MILINDSGSMEFTVLKYEFPNANPSSDNNYKYDANWLTVQIKYTDSYGQEDIRTDNCLLTCELESFRDALRDLINGDLFQYRSAFMEPYLRIEIRRFQDEYHMAFDYGTDLPQAHNKTVRFSVLLTKTGLGEVLDSVEAFCKMFPKR